MVPIFSDREVEVRAVIAHESVVGNDDRLRPIKNLGQSTVTKVDKASSNTSIAMPIGVQSEDESCVTEQSYLPPGADHHKRKSASSLSSSISASLSSAVGSGHDSTPALLKRFRVLTDSASSSHQQLAVAASDSMATPNMRLVLSYSITIRIPGKFDAKRATQLGVPRGPLFGPF